MKNLTYKYTILDDMGIVKDQLNFPDEKSAEKSGKSFLKLLIN
jgi:hypothetical protein